MKVYFTSDLHIGHENAIKFDKRPFNNVNEMNEEVIRRWNNKVMPEDLVYSLGDMFWRGDCKFIQDVLSKLNGTVILIKGNHDRWLHNSGNKKMLAAVKDYDDIKVTLQDGTVKRCILSHYFIPFYNGHYYGAIHLHGHTHQTDEASEERKIALELNRKGFSNETYNVGCMYYDYEPVTLDEIIEKWENKLY